ncbi:MAG: phosphate ABC transporter permease subunit PstC [Leptolyngbyaceae cyanobacterium SL_5_9]|nr:phosphate ABC transporter permease subunit PstC [Leptolyngbyaceae cyanobacterium SL_5_9]NJO75027.1 phosphate ABC transporter permease subunit PstC [Leptolyngbyaceae cyanobacterium RM1_406_9]
MRWIEQGVRFIFGSFALVSVGTTIGVISTLIFETFSFFQEVPLWRFLTDTQWTPLFVNPTYGIVVLMSATVMIAAIALLVAIPLGLLSAICLSEYAPPQVRRWLKPILEILAGVPTVVYGYFALLFVTPLLQKIVPGLQSFNALSAGIVVGIAIMPLVASLIEDAIYAVPQSLRQGAYALGATKELVLPQAFSGILTGSILAMSRAIGETASLITIGALTFIAFLPPLFFEGLRTPFTALPIQTFNWVSRPQQGFHTNAAAAIIVLMVVLLSMSTTAIYLRDRFRRNQSPLT